MATRTGPIRLFEDEDTESPAGRLAWLHDCPDCSGPLDWSQPDPGRPASILAVCCECNEWFRYGDDGTLSRLVAAPCAGSAP